jgi:hypothetical protein
VLEAGRIRQGRILGYINVRDSVGATGDGALAGLAVPDTDRVSADGDLAAEGAGVLGVLGDFHLLHLLTQGSTITVKPCQSESCVRQHTLIISRPCVPFAVKNCCQCSPSAVSTL